MRDKVIFLDIDTQYDFMNPAGKLYVPGAEKIIPNFRRLFRIAAKKGITVLSSLDTHKRNDPEFKDFPEHCIKGTRGYEKIKETIIKRAGRSRQLFIIKDTIDLFSNKRIKSILKEYRIAYVFGVALDYCVKAACLGLVRSGLKTYLIKDATKAASAQGRKETLGILQRNGVKLVTTDTMVERIDRL